ncbi:uncharacterized protein PITG_18492 [Phytophthora infestans T30-4]|uniref:Uncharacterized protein n=1 Tax=Phytophthora infestans (strain T30-4) TaxID=403677 RepID=D0NYE3_PHYIT|nr:uncharacterized protein PITG_18492 [Phytophthora infestans T30-4]EEY68055.1 conserved hypothetical protein [Phytophthora infestans T30-4]|eukprot:XP_002997613.1 conserved hypothetical protein [Phytophthora infestans T30-4]
MVVLAARKEHFDGQGRLLYKWFDALHAYWCVFLPEAVTLTWKTTVKYWYGSGAELQRTWAHTWFVVVVWWTVVTLIVYATFYGVLFLYEIVEGVCVGWPGVVILTVTMDYTFASNGGVVGLGERGEGVEILSGRMSRRSEGRYFTGNSVPKDVVTCCSTKQSSTLLVSGGFVVRGRSLADPR